MGQQEVLNCLEKHKKAMTGRQIAEALGQCDKKIYEILRKLMKWKEICWKEIPFEEAYKLYGSKRRMYIYAISEKFL